MRLALRAIALVCTAATTSVANSGTVRIATWNLGWHVSQQELSPWISQCSKTYAKDPQGVWRLAPAGTPQAKRGWEISESRVTLEGVDLSVMPPCAVYTTSSFQGIEVTTSSYIRRQSKIAQVLTNDVRPDVIAFQEVSGTQAVREALGEASSDYNVCSFDGSYKVQRLAFAWKKALGTALQPCTDIKEVSLPALPQEKQVRPAYTVTLSIAGKKVAFMTVHLKSGCVSSLENGRLDGNTGPDDPCPILQQQVAPLEASWEALSTNVDFFVVLGDFNRNLWHEQGRVTGSEPIRSDGETDLSKPRTATVTTRNLLLEINDGSPLTSKGELLSASCIGSPELGAACDASKTSKLTTEQKKVLAASSGLGCRNPVGLDHILVSQSLAPAVKAVQKISIGSLGLSLMPRPPQFPEPLLAISDHCPVVMEVDF